MSYSASDEIIVNSTLDGSQFGIEPIVLANGGRVHVWRSQDVDNGQGTFVGAGLFLQRFDAEGETVGGERPVETVTTGFQISPVATALNNGGWVVGWTASGFDGSADPLGNGVFIQRYNANGAAVGGEVLVNTGTVGSQDINDIVTLADGSFVVSWESQGGDADGTAVFMQHFAANGTRIDGETRINTTETGSQFESHLTALANGGWVAHWGILDPNTNFTAIELMQQVYDKNGNKIGGEKQVNGTFEGTETQLRDVTVLDGGKWVVTWMGRDIDGDVSAAQDYGIYHQLYSANGAEIGNEVRVNTTTEGFQANSGTAAIDTGGWVTAWQMNDGSSSGIFMQRFNANGGRIGGETLVNTTTANSQEAPIAVEALADGGWVIGWSSREQDAVDAVTNGTQYGIFLQRYSINGQAVGGEIQIHQSMTSDQHQVTLTALDNGDFIASWRSQHRDNATSDVMERVFHYTPDTFFGSDLGETLNGTLLDDIFVGKKGNDVYRINHIDDVAVERVNAGLDTLRASVTVDLANFGNVENVTMTGAGRIAAKGSEADNALTGNGADNILTGLGGRDVLVGGGGRDRLDGGRGGDTLTGGAGVPDTFVFRTGDGADIINDFDATGADHDTLDIRNLVAVTSFADLSTDHMEAFGNNVLIDTGNGDSITLLGVRLRDLDRTDFLI